VVGYIQVSEIKDVYSAQSTLLIGVPESQVVDIETVLSGSNSYGDVISEMEVLRSRGLAAKVIERLKLLNNPEFNPSLAEPEESLFDFIQYLDPRSWVPESWKKSVKEAMGMETEHAEPPPMRMVRSMRRSKTVAPGVSRNEYFAGQAERGSGRIWQRHQREGLLARP
jgi:uncharacterized protein involved in exopolysaccharide biosynthesis